MFKPTVKVGIGSGMGSLMTSGIVVRAEGVRKGASSW